LVCLLSASFLSSLFTIFSNLLTAIILIKSRSHGSISNLFIISLSIADMFVGVTMLLLLAYILLISSSTWSFALPWICDAWQVTDFFLSTVSLYSICAIALDRILNLEKPLHRFKRSRRLAVRLIFCVWFVPLLIWVPFYYTLTTHTRNAVASHGEKVICATGYSDPMLIFVVSLFVFYIPSVLLIAMFARISMVVHKHFSFLRKHSNNPRSPLLIRKVSSIQTLTLKKESNCGGGLRVRPTHHLTISSEEHRPLCERSYKSYGELEEETSGKDKVVRECKKSSLQLSVISRTNSMKFSIVGFPAQLKVLLQKDSVSRQILSSLIEKFMSSSSFQKLHLRLGVCRGSVLELHVLSSESTAVRSIQSTSSGAHHLQMQNARLFIMQAILHVESLMQQLNKLN
uniref:G_PROTEIN_RECEP_F1_2 domain-containing protein n=1 Tax=Heligmosomoides polygyrus TaxID=6339 RepID=A0A8L8KJ02_HELPZ